MRKITSKKYHSKPLDNDILATLYSEIFPWSVSLRVMWNLTWSYTSASGSPPYHVFSSTMKTLERQRLPFHVFNALAKHMALVYLTCQFINRDEDQTLKTCHQVSCCMYMWCTCTSVCTYTYARTHAHSHARHKPISGVILGSLTS